MNVFYEETGSLKAAAVIQDNNASLQVQTQHGKRAKVKAATVLMRFEHHSLDEFMERARTVADEIDAGFLWETCGEAEFSFETLAAEYFGHSPAPEEAAGVLMRLHDTPTHFYKKGKGRFKPAPADALNAALASIERKRKQAELQAEYVASLSRFELPDVFRPLLNQLLYKPDRTLIETKALEQACAHLKLSAPRLLEKCGALPSTHDYHLGRFLFEYFPRGVAFDPQLTADDVADLPLASVKAFSIDDWTTTEIDDAFSVTPLDNGHWRIGVHIAAPALGIAAGSALDEQAQKRMSTVYFPGNKITMLPEPVVAMFTLAEGRDCPALSMYVDVDAEMQIYASRSVVERVRIASNLHHNTLDTVMDEQAVASGYIDSEYGDELLLLYRFAVGLEKRRGKTSDNQNQRTDYSFYVDDDRISIVPRKRGAPLDKLVAELMIMANGEWGRMLAEAGVPGLYRTQTSGKVKMSTVPGAHEGLGLAHYIWATSPLRRYADLVNQRQLINVVREASPVYAPRDQRLYEIVRGFELAYDAYAEFQRSMERYWCLRWLLQEQISDVRAEIIRDDLVRFERIPLICRAPSVPPLTAATKVELRLSAIDLIDLAVHCEFQKVLERTDITT